MLRCAGVVTGLGLLWAATAGVCSAAATPDPTDTAATLITVLGQVSVLRDSQPWALSPGDRIKPKQVVLTGPDGYALFKVADGSTFEVFPNSRVTFRDNPGDWRDLLDVLLGRIKVHIQKTFGQPNLNKVRTPSAIISVRGTVFDVAIEDDDTTLVVVEEGQVEVAHAVHPGPAKLLNEGEWLRIYKNQPLAKSSIDRTNVVRAMLRAVSDAIYTTIANSGGSPRGGGVPGGGGSGGGGLPGDHGDQNPPPNKPPTDSGGTPPPTDSGGTPPPK